MKTIKNPLSGEFDFVNKATDFTSVYDLRYLLLDQTAPQTIINGVPLMTTAVDEYGSGNQLVNMDYVRGGTWLMPPIIDWYDPTGGLPVDPEVGDRYGSDATANGWTIDYIYEWDGDEWIESAPEEGWMLWDLFGLIMWVFFSGGWMEMGEYSYWTLDTAQIGITGDKSGSFNLLTTGTLGAGNTTVTQLNLADSQHIYLGTGNDLDIYHNGTNSYIDNDTGSLYFINNDSSYLSTPKISFQALTTSSSDGDAPVGVQFLSAINLNDNCPNTVVGLDFYSSMLLGNGGGMGYNPVHIGVNFNIDMTGDGVYASAVETQYAVYYDIDITGQCGAAYGNSLEYIKNDITLTNATYSASSSVISQSNSVYLEGASILTAMRGIQFTLGVKGTSYITNDAVYLSFDPYFSDTGYVGGDYYGVRLVWQNLYNATRVKGGQIYGSYISQYNHTGNDAYCYWGYAQSSATNWVFYNASTGNNLLGFDGAKTYFGTDLDLSIYHDGSNAYIDNSTGLLDINCDILLATGTSYNYLHLYNSETSIKWYIRAYCSSSTIAYNPVDWAAAGYEFTNDYGAWADAYYSDNVFLHGLGNDTGGETEGYDGNMWDIIIPTENMSNNMTKLICHVVGYNNYVDMGLYVYNWNTEEWELFDTGTGNTEGTKDTLTAEITTNAPDYVHYNGVSYRVSFLWRNKVGATIDGRGNMYSYLDNLNFAYATNPVLTDQSWDGNLTVRGNLYINGNFFPKTLIPAYADAYDLGSSGLTWVNAYVQKGWLNDLKVSGSLAGWSSYNVEFSGDNNHVYQVYWDYRSTRASGNVYFFTQNYEYDPIGADETLILYGDKLFLERNGTVDAGGNTIYGRYTAAYFHPEYATADTSAHLIVGNYSKSYGVLDCTSGNFAAVTNFISHLFDLPTFTADSGTITGASNKLGWFSQGDCMIATGKKLYFEGTLSGNTLTMGDSYIVYNTGSSYIEFWVGGTRRGYVDATGWHNG